MSVKCPNLACPRAQKALFFDPKIGPRVRRIVRNGRYYRASDSRWIERFHCQQCRRYFSRSSSQPTYRQKKRRVNAQVYSLLSSGVSQRRAARLLRVNRKTVVRKFRFLAIQARQRQERFLRTLEKRRLGSVQWDDLETSEHTKCKPLSVAIAVEPGARKILGFQVSRMPAKGRLAEIALKKYGPRPDERAKGWRSLMRGLARITKPDALIRTDENPHYPRHVRRAFPSCRHERVPSRRACVAGLGELKKGGFDPLFSLNHTYAMTRANMNRLFRRTWCTTKTIRGLTDHLWIYVDYHNRVLTSASAG